MAKIGACLLCAQISSDEIALCPACQGALPRMGDCCARCAIALPAITLNGLCGNCLFDPPAFDHCFSLGPYEYPLRELISRFKFQGSFSCGAALAQLLAMQLEPHWQTQCPTLLLPVPLHPSRLRGRGFNQSGELARILARHFPTQMTQTLCQRIRATPSQKGLSAQERASNLRGAFSIGEWKPAWRHVAIVDDVVTTMSTVNEIARLLKKRGAERVDVVSLARVN